MVGSGVVQVSGLHKFRGFSLRPVMPHGSRLADQLASALPANHPTCQEITPTIP